MANCKKCNDTGVIETGNSDVPCECPAGDTVVFSGLNGPETGAEIKKRALEESSQTS